jgi:glycosyltransferase involved in cell wall biosynthesis
MKVNVCIVTIPLSEAASAPLANLVKLFSRLANRVYVVSGGAALNALKLDSNVRPMRVTHRVSSKLLMRLINYVHTQLKISRCVIEASGDVDFFVFFIGGEGLILPMLLLKLLKKKVLLMPGGVVTRVYSLIRDSLSKFVSLLATINFFLADRIVVYSPALIQELNVKCGNKIVVAHEHFIDSTKFVVKKKINERANVVGYIGRFTEEKGILNFVKSIPLVLKRRKDFRFMLCGDGKLSDEIRNIIQCEGLEAYVKLTGWVSHEDVPNFLNDLKLLILPSYSEGLPNIMLEAMACETPVLATPVGAIPDMIRDGETGFLLKSNDPKYIAEKIVELLNKPELLEKVSKNAYKWVRENFSEEKTLESWRRILHEFETR